MKYKAPRKMNPIKLVEVTAVPEIWNMYEVGPYGFYTQDRASHPVIGDWHRYTMMGCRLFVLNHKGQNHSFLAAGFRKREPVAHIYLTYTPLRSRGQGYAKELKRQFFDLCKAEGIQTITVDCQTPDGEALFKDGVTAGKNKHGRPQKSYSLAQFSVTQSVKT